MDLQRLGSSNGRYYVILALFAKTCRGLKAQFVVIYASDSLLFAQICNVLEVTICCYLRDIHFISIDLQTPGS